jgi:hypothetical protein
VYAADQEAVGRVQLYAVAIDGGPVVRLSTSGLILGGSLASDAFVRIDPTGQRAAFLQRDSMGRHALYSAPLDGSAEPRQLTPLATATRPIRSDFRIDPSGAYALYRVDQDVTGVVELWSVPLSGATAPVELNLSLTQGGVDPQLVFVPGAERVVFRASDPADGRDALWSAALDGSVSAVRLDEARGDGVLAGFAVAPQGAHVVYAASSAEAPAVFNLFAAPVDGQEPAFALTGFAADDVTSFEVGAGHVVFALRPGAGGDVLLYTVPVDGSVEPQLVDPTLVAGGSVRDDFVLTRDGRGVAFVAQRPGELALFTAPTDASFAPLLVDTLGGNSLVGGLEFSSDGSRLVYLADAREPGSIELWSVLADGSAARRSLSGPLVFGGDVQEFELATRGQVALYLADADIDGAHALYGVALAGGVPALELSEPLPSGPIEGDVLAVELVPGSDLALYLATQEEADRVELYAVETAARGRVRKLNGPLVAGGNVRLHRTSLSAGRVVYVADQDADEAFRLHSVPLDGSAPALRIGRDLGPDRDVEDFVFTPDGGRAIYLADGRVDGLFELFLVALDGSGEDLRVSGVLPPGGALDLTSVAVTPDLTSVVYFGDQEVDEVFRVFAAPLDASEDPVALGGDMVAGGDVLLVQPASPFRLTPDGMHVVYVADALVDGRFELFRAALDGSAGVPLSGPLVAGGNVEPGFELTPDGSSVVYRADAQVNGVYELFIVPVDASEPPRKLNGFVFSGGKVWRFQIVPDGSRVLYLADQDVRGVVELHSVPLDGSRPAIRLHPQLGPRADVASAFEPGWPLAVVTPSGTHVVYRADRDIDELDEVYVVPIDGSAAPLELNGSFGAPLFHTARPDIAISSDSRTVFYRAGPHGGSAVDLYRVPLDGRHPPGRISTGVERHLATADASRILYLADPGGAGVIELFLTLLDRPRSLAETPTRAVIR